MTSLTFLRRDQSLLTSAPTVASCPDDPNCGLARIPIHMRHMIVRPPALKEIATISLAAGTPLG